MSCFLEENDNHVYAVLGFEREQLLYDIKNCSFIEGSVMDTDSHHQRHMVQDVGEEGNVDRVTRILDLVVSQCKELLYPYTNHRIYRHALNDKLKNHKVYGIVLKLPYGFSQTTLDLLERLIHELLVCKAMEEWMRLTNPAKASSWAEKAADAMSEIRLNLMTRMHRTRIKPHWI